MTKKERYKFLIDYFLEHRPKAETELVYMTPYELAVATILSAQCTDKRVNMITPAFFKKFPDAGSLAKAKQEKVFELIRSCSYPNNKAKNLIGMANSLMKDFSGVLPSDIEQMMTIPGIGRKTANVLAAVIFNKPAMAVDTHVFRVAARIGLATNSKTPFQTEMQLVKNLPEHLIPLAHHWLILHGRYICMARKPKCSECGLTIVCKYYSQLSRT
ncbi:MAG: endonuclease III [Bacteroidetes bacterium]|nr:endonuclease III [Bacteroidota bacterium]